MENFSEIYTYKRPVYTTDSPVAVNRVGVYYDANIKRRQLLCKITNIGEKVITSATVVFGLFDKDGNKIGESYEYVYEGLSCAEGESFGQKTAVLTPVPGVFKCAARVKSVAFDDGSEWVCEEGAKWQTVAPPKRIVNMLTDPYQRLAYRKRFGSSARFAYEDRENVKICTCGAINRKEGQRCTHCGTSFAELASLNTDALEKEGLYLTAQHRMNEKCSTKKLHTIKNVLLSLDGYSDSRALIENINATLEERKRRSTKIRKRVIGASSALVVLTMLVIATITLFIPLIKVNVANGYYQEGRYDEALELYYDVNGFGNSDKCVLALNTANNLKDANPSEIKNLINDLLEAGIPVSISYDVDSDGKINTDNSISPASLYANNNGATGSDICESYSANTTFKSFASAKKTGYTLDKWSFSSYSYDVTDKDAPFEILLSPSWIAREYTVYFNNTHDGSNVTVSFDFLCTDIATQKTTLTDKETLNPPSNPFRQGYIFCGWYTNPECTERFDFTSKISKDITLYAKWYEIPKRSDSHSAAQVNASQYDSPYISYSISTSSTSSTSKKYLYLVADKDGTHSINYKNSSSYSSDRYIIAIKNLTSNTGILSDISVSSTSYQTKSFQCNKGDVIEISIYKYSYISTAYLYFKGFENLSPSTAIADCPANQSYTYDSQKTSTLKVKYDSMLTLPAPTREGYVFIGWYDNADKKYESGAYTYDQNLTLNPKWQSCEYSVTLDPNGGSVSQNTVAASYGKNVTLPTPTKSGYTFLGWYNNNVKFESGEWKTAESITLTAAWQAATYSVKLSDTERFSVKVTYDYNYTDAQDTTVTLYHGNKLERTTPTRDGYVFIGWFLDEECKERYTFEGYLSEDIRLYAGWHQISTTNSNNTFIITPSNYLSSDKNYSVSTSGTSYSAHNYVYFVAEEFGAHTLYYSATASSYYYILQNATTSSTIKSSTYVSSSSYSSFTFTCNAGDVIVLEIYSYSSSYPTTANFYFSGFKAASQSTATADYSKISVTFNENHMEGKITTVNLSNGAALSRPTKPTRTGFLFCGWYLDKGMTQKYDFSGTLEKSTTLYAGWRSLSASNSYSNQEINPITYNSSSNYYYTSLSGTSSSSKKHFYFVAEESGAHSVFYKNSSSSSSYGFYITVNNLTTNTVLFSSSNYYQTTYSEASFNCNAGDVISISLYRYSSSYSPYAYIYFSGFSNAPQSTATADITRPSEYVYKEGASTDITVTYGQPFALPTITFPSNELFLGWYVNGTETKITDGVWNNTEDMILVPKK